MFYRLKQLKDVGPEGRPVEGLRCGVRMKGGHCVRPATHWQLNHDRIRATCEAHGSLCRNKPGYPWPLMFCSRPATIVRLQEVVSTSNSYPPRRRRDRLMVRGQLLCDACDSMLSFVRAFGMSWQEYSEELRHPRIVSALECWARTQRPDAIETYEVRQS